MGIRIGIDVGTSNSSIAIYDGETAEALAVNEGVISVYGGEKRLSSAVYLQEDNKSLILGQAAYNMRMRHPERFASEFKRAFGSEVPIVLGEKIFPIDDIYKAFFRKLVSFAEKIDTIDEAFITHPADYSMEMIQRIKKAANLAGLYNITTLDEPSAAAAEYATLENLEKESIILVYDFGGGTFDTALIQKMDIGFKHLTSPLGINDCGGSDFDHLLLEDIVSRIKKEYGEDVEKFFANPKAVADYSERAVKIKHQLSLSESYTENFTIGYEWFECTFTRQEFNKMIAPYVQKTCDLVHTILRKAGVEKSSVSKVLLVGGTSSIPYVKEKLAEMFGRDKIVEIANPDLAVCLGAVQFKIEDKILAKKGNAEAQYRLGTSYMNKNGKEYNPSEAVFWLEKSAAQENTDAQTNLGYCYEIGCGVPKNKEKAHEYYKMAARKGNAEAKWRLANYYGASTYASFIHLDESAKYGKVEAQYVLGRWYKKNKEVFYKDSRRKVWYEEAFYWLEKAAMQENAYAQYELGECYFDGIGTSKDMGKAFYWFQKSAEQNICPGLYKVALCYKNGWGIEKDLKQSYSYFERAYKAYIPNNEENVDELIKINRVLVDDEFFTKTMYELGVCYLNGIGTVQDYQKAFDYFNTNFEYTDTIACKTTYMLAECYFHGWGTDRNDKKAFELYQEAAEKEDLPDGGQIHAAYRLAECYLCGRGVECDCEAAILWLKKISNESGSKEVVSEALKLLGDCYLYGVQWLDQDKEQAVEWYQKAAKLENVQAIQRLNELKKLMIINNNGEIIAYKKTTETKQKTGPKKEDKKQNIDDYAEREYELGIEHRAKNEMVNAFSHFLNAAEAGLMSAQFEVGYCYYNGDGIGQDLNEAFLWFKKAATQGHVGADYYLAVCVNCSNNRK